MASCLRTMPPGGTKGEKPSAEVAMVLKVSTTASLNRAADLLMQALGGRGYMETNLAPQLMRDARVLSIGEGANEGLVAALGRSVRIAG
jgi:alkylation response protein AidB-like acyl-CoA dehydrogenase